MLPPDLLQHFCNLKGIASPERCSVRPMDGANDVYCITDDSQGPMKKSSAPGWIVRDSPNWQKELAAGGILKAIEAPTFNIERLSLPQDPQPGAAALTDNWLILELLPYPTLGDFVKAHGVSGELMKQLGTAAMDADLLSMRDRKLNNLMIRESDAQVTLIDYEGAFNAGIFDRLVRPKRYLRYLLVRLVFDVFIAARSAGHDVEDEAFLIKQFCDGMFARQQRLKQIVGAALWTGDSELAKLTTTNGLYGQASKARWGIRSRLASEKRLRRLLPATIAAARTRARQVQP